MRKILLTCSIGLLMQACVPAPTKTNPSNHPEGFSERFSIEKIKQKKEQEFAQKLLNLNNMNPRIEAQKAVANNSIYLMAYEPGRGSSTKIPGLTESQVSVHKCSVLQLDGMGDVIYGENHLKYRVAAQKYASQFNIAMYPRCL